MKFIYIFGLVVSSYLLLKQRQKSTKLLMVHSNNRLSKLFHLINVKFFENLKPSIFLFSGHAQTFLLELMSIIGRFVKKLFKIHRFKYERKIFKLSDGCHIAIDHAKSTRKFDKRQKVLKNGINEKIENNDKILLILPGVTSTSDDYYVKALVEDFCEEFDCRVINARGFAGVKLQSPLMISSSCSIDIGEYIDFVSKENSDKKVFAVGFSFGGLLLVKYLGMNADKIPKNFLAGTGLCYPCCLEETKNYAEVHFNGIYSKATLSNVKKTFYENIDTIFDMKTHKGIKKSEVILTNKENIIKQVRDCQLLSDFDRVWTSLVLGFDDVKDYYQISKLDQYISKIKVPFLSIFTEDDPIIPISSIPFKTLQANSNTVTVVTQHGGHLGFFGGMLFPQRVMDQPIRTFLRTVEILKETEHYSLNSVS